MKCSCGVRTRQTATVENQSEKMHELEEKLAEATDFLDKVETVKEDALTVAESTKAFVRVMLHLNRETRNFIKCNNEIYSCFFSVLFS